MQRETGMRGLIHHDERRSSDPLLRLIAELREQVDRMIDEQKGMIALLAASGASEDERGGAAEPAAPSTEPAGLPLLSMVEPVSRTRRPAPPPAFDRIDEPSHTPPRPVSTSATMTAAPADAVPAGGRSDDPRDRLDALAKHLDRKLKQPGGSAPAADAPARHPD